ncbi:hypothetical protein AD951_07635 [Acetobacter malorum]|uniref:Uncharacterized protein n=1 Tax=Acetobacter malorum TaxID=178901 RepID=A0A149UMR0_9PROT|nr:hypothetical protein [Acetobacter malorum]KXV69202.1 hypothetical protein AD951_07635 [Acetobacter malorum]
MTESFDYASLRMALVAKPDMWSGRGLSLIQAIDGTRIDIRSHTLLEDLEEVATENPEIQQLLESLPGWPTSDRANALEQLNFVASAPRELLASVTGLEPQTKGQQAEQETQRGE